jgi:biotin carboxyl carrier protein
MPDELDWAADPIGDQGGAPVVVEVDGRAARIELAEAPSVRRAAAQASGSGGRLAAVVAPMPGTVLAVRVRDGERVGAGATLVVVEAMKMENAVTAPTDGQVERVLVKPGEAVQRGDRLVELG